MSRKSNDKDVPAFPLQNESTRQRWELFHRAIAHAKQSNLDAMSENDSTASETRSRRPQLSIVR